MRPQMQTGGDPPSRRDAAPRPAILVVDDSATNLVALDALLSSLDVDVVRAASGEEALKQMLARDFALVLMDIQMPGLDGFETTALIRQRDRNRHTPVIFVTAIFKDDASVQKAYSLGAVDYVTKPFDEAILKAKVAALTNHHRQLDLIERQAAALRDKQAEADREHAARKDAEAAGRMKDEFLAILSHELRAPLTAIVGWSSRLQGRTDLPADVAESIDVIVRNSHLQKKLIDDLLDLSQMVAGKTILANEQVDLAAVVQSALAEMAPAASAKRIKLDLDVAPERYEILGDARRLQQMICALLSNAIKFSENDSVVRVELSSGGAGVQVRVKDTGVGIRAEVLPTIFERFRQGDASWTRLHGGLGIGLAIAQHLATLHHGSIEAFSAGEGTGAVFVVTLPRSPTVSAAVVPVPPAAKGSMSMGKQPLGGLRVLVVDDDADTRELLAAMLEQDGAAVVAAPSVPEAVTRFRTEHFDIVVSDLGMPGEDGLALVKQLRRLDGERAGTLKAIALSGYGSDEDRAQTANAGFDAHITKPVDSADLVAALVRLTNRA